VAHKRARVEGVVFRSLPAEDFPHQPPRIFKGGVHSPAELLQPERRARAFGAEPGRVDPLPQLGRVVGRELDHDLVGLGIIADNDVADPLLGRRGGLDRERMVESGGGLGESIFC